MLGIEDVGLVRNAQCRGLAVMNNSLSYIHVNILAAKCVQSGTQD
jgi:hypothetical protein